MKFGIIGTNYISDIVTILGKHRINYTGQSKV